MELMKEDLFNEDTKRKADDIKNAQALIIESRGRNRNRGQKVMISLRECPNLEIK